MWLFVRLLDVWLTIYNKNKKYVKFFLTNLLLSKLYEVPDGKV